VTFATRRRAVFEPTSMTATRIGVILLNPPDSVFEGRPAAAV